MLTFHCLQFDMFCSVFFLNDLLLEVSHAWNNLIWVKFSIIFTLRIFFRIYLSSATRYWFILCMCNNTSDTSEESELFLCFKEACSALTRCSFPLILERWFKLRISNVHRCWYLIVPSFSQAPAILSERCKEQFGLAFFQHWRSPCVSYTTGYPLRTQGNSEPLSVFLSEQVLLIWLLSAQLFKKCLLTTRLIYINGKNSISTSWYTEKTRCSMC